MEDKELKEPSCSAHQGIARETGMRSPATVSCGINCPGEKFLPNPQGSILIQEHLYSLNYCMHGVADDSFVIYRELLHH